VKVAKDRHLVIVTYGPQQVIETTAHAHAEDAIKHAQQARARPGVASVEEVFAPCFQGRRVTRVWL
jgi:hypothetical protein